jgi:hypothetical protein
LDIKNLTIFQRIPHPPGVPGGCGKSPRPLTTCTTLIILVVQGISNPEGVEVQNQGFHPWDHGVDEKIEAELSEGV